jgi:hypothetical protein
VSFDNQFYSVFVQGERDDRIAQEQDRDYAMECAINSIHLRRLLHKAKKYPELAEDCRLASESLKFFGV